MKFNCNINIEVEAKNMEDAQSIAAQLAYVGSYSNGSARITGMNINEAYHGSLLVTDKEVEAKTPAEGADADNDGDDGPF